MEPGDQEESAIAEIYGWIFIGIRRKNVLDMKFWKFEIKPREQNTSPPSSRCQKKNENSHPKPPQVCIEPSCHERRPNNASTPPLPSSHSHTHTHTHSLSLSLIPRRLGIRPRAPPLPENPRLDRRIVADGEHGPAHLPAAILNAHRPRSAVRVGAAGGEDALAGRVAVADAGGVGVAVALARAAAVVAAADGGVGAGAGNGGAGSGLAGGAGCALREGVCWLIYIKLCGRLWFLRENLLYGRSCRSCRWMFLGCSNRRRISCRRGDRRRR
jgi:hypothetical protein